MLGTHSNWYALSSFWLSVFVFLIMGTFISLLVLLVGILLLFTGKDLELAEGWLGLKVGAFMVLSILRIHFNFNFLLEFLQKKQLIYLVGSGVCTTISTSSDESISGMLFSNFFTVLWKKNYLSKTIKLIEIQSFTWSL